MSIGEMIKPPSLTMLEAMNALSILDPRTDTGDACYAGPSHLPEPIDINPANGMNLDAEVIIGIMDRLVQLEVNPMRGATEVVCL